MPSTTAIRISEIAFTGYPVTDIARAREFYEGLLHLQPARVFGEGAQLWVEYDLGPATLAITSMSADWKPSSSGPMVAFEVEDVDAAVAQLREAGVTFALDPVETPGCRFAVVLDPDGNSLAIHRKKRQ